MSEEITDTYLITSSQQKLMSVILRLYNQFSLSELPHEAHNYFLLEAWSDQASFTFQFQPQCHVLLCNIQIYSYEIG